MGIFIFIALSIYFMVNIIKFAIWDYDCEDATNKIKFESFKSFYNINPERWILHDGCVICKDPTRFNGIKFKFNYIDYKRYKRFCKNIDKYNERINSNKDCARMIELVKLDISKIEAQGKSEFETFTKNLNVIMGNGHRDRV